MFGDSIFKPGEEELLAWMNCEMERCSRLGAIILKEPAGLVSTGFGEIVFNTFGFPMGVKLAVFITFGFPIGVKLVETDFGPAERKRRKRSKTQVFTDYLGKRETVRRIDHFN